MIVTSDGTTIMFFVVLILAKISVCISILLYSSLIGISSFLIHGVIKTATIYHERSFWSIIKIGLCSAGVLGYDLTPNLVSTMSHEDMIRICIVQIFFCVLGVYLLRQSIARNYVMSQMKKSIVQLKLIDTQKIHATAGR